MSKILIVEDEEAIADLENMAARYGLPAERIQAQPCILCLENIRRYR